MLLGSIAPRICEVDSSMLRNTTIVLAGRLAMIVVQLGSAMVLARILTPAEFGTFSVAAAAVGLLQGLREFGSANYIVRADLADRDTVGSALFVSASVSLALGAAVWLSAGPLAQVFGSADVKLIVQLLAVNFVFAPVLMLGAALLTRAERFGTRTMIDVGAAITGALVSIALALGGWSSLSLALGLTANSIAAMLAYLWVRPEGFALALSLRRVREAFRFGGWLSGINVANQIAERGTELVIGKIAGLAAVGFFDKGSATARMVSQLSASVLFSVVFATAARERREGADAANLYQSRLTILTGIVWPILAVLVICAEPVIRVLYGQSWMAAVPVAQAVALSTMLLIPCSLTDQLLIVGGAEKVVFMYRVAYAIVRLAVVAIAINYGITAAAYALILSALYLGALQKRRVEGLYDLVGPWLFVALLPSALITLAVAMVVWGVQWWAAASGVGSITVLAVCAVAGVCAWVIATGVLPSPLTEVRKKLLIGVRGWVALKTVGGRMSSGRRH